MLFKFKHLFFLLSLSLVILSCAEENPDLVNPPSSAGTVSVRFINLAGDFEARQLNLSQGKVTGSTTYSTSSPVINPPSDSVIIGTLHNGIAEYSQKAKFHFIRDSYNTCFALPKQKSASGYRAVDTLIMISTVTGLPVNITNAYVSVFDAFPDTTARYLVNIGCPNGTSVEPNAVFRAVGAIKQTPAGDVVFSLIKIKDNLPQIIGLYEVTLLKGRQYILVILANAAGTEELWLLDQEYEKFTQVPLAMGSFYKASLVPERLTYIRTINFSSDPIRTMKNDEVIADIVQPNQINNYNSIGACQSNEPDSLNVFANGNPAGNILTSLKVLQKYSILVFDSVGTSNKLIMLAPQVDQNSIKAGQSMIRVVFANFAHNSMTLALGARDDTTSVGYSSGIVLASDIFGDISPTVAIRPGNVPLTLFTSTQPKNLLYSSTFNFEADKNYLVILKNSPGNGDQLIVIEDNTENQPVNFLSNKVFADVANLVTGTQKITSSIAGLLTNASLSYSYTLSTVIDEGTTAFTLNGKTSQVTANNMQRVLVIGAGTNENTDIISIVSDPMGANFGVNYKRRFINACSEIPGIDVGIDCDTCFVVRNLQYGSASYPETINLERNVAIFFKNSATGELLLRSEVPLTKGINYSIIFGGNKTSYNMVVQQQF